MFQERLFRLAGVVSDVPLEFLPHFSFFRVGTGQNLINDRGRLPAQRLQIRVRSAELAGPDAAESRVAGATERQNRGI
ncbi:hypothetical protein [Arthrobacter sp. 9MFCol3.1]|uniref:hypothetical protein n=1 Tax=Arthrobacter sp. 9MFCol3.1 TaxID=1150398 RepID=UPI00047C0F90|nr:hypothetical protein [Arthrobacter sp. 9MFCol3.1]